MTPPPVVPNLLYADVDAALGFLSDAFGFGETLRYTDPAGHVSHAEMRLGEALIMLGRPEGEYRNPRRLGQETVHVHVHVEDVDAHHARARAAGADVRAEPADQPWGERSYAAVDPQGPPLVLHQGAARGRAGGVGRHDALRGALRGGACG